MRIKPHIFKSTIPPDGPHGPHFARSKRIQKQLETICLHWSEYLCTYIETTSPLFGNPEIPWQNTERAIISTLAASIIRNSPGSIALEEARVAKPGQKQNDAANKAGNSGRCDLWINIPCEKSKAFTFYLEAKKVKRGKSAAGLLHFLHGRNGVSRIFRDYMKYHPGVLTKRSASQPKRDHSHYVIGMYVIPVDKAVTDFKEIEKVLHKAFETRRELKMGSSSRQSAKSKYRNMKRYPTVALCVIGDSLTDKQDGFIATFTILGATRDLWTKKKPADKAAGLP